MSILQDCLDKARAGDVTTAAPATVTPIASAKRAPKPKSTEPTIPKLDPQAFIAKQEDEYGGSLHDYLGDDDPGDDADAWLIPGIVAAGVPQMTAGHPKSCKTFLMEHVAISIAAGIPWLGQFPTTRGRVLVLPREDSQRETRRRIWRLARGLGLDPRSLDGWLKIDSLKPFYWSDGADVARLLRTIERWQPSLIVLDSLSRTHLGDENSVKDMSTVCNTWSDLALRTNTAISIIHHFTKSGAGTLLQQLRGSGNIGATLRHLVGVEKATVHGDPFELAFDGNLHPLSPAFQVRMRDDMRDGHKVIVMDHAGTVQDARVQEIDDAIRRALENAGVDGLTASQLTSAVKGQQQTVIERRNALTARIADAAGPDEIVRVDRRYFRSLAAMRGVAAPVVTMPVPTQGLTGATGAMLAGWAGRRARA